MFEAIVTTQWHTVCDWDATVVSSITKINFIRLIFIFCHFIILVTRQSVVVSTVSH